MSGRERRVGLVARLQRGAGADTRESSPVPWLRRLRNMFVNNALLKSVSLVLAVALFFLVNTDTESVIGVNMRVSYTLPDDRVLVSELTDQIQLTIRGPTRRIKRFDERELGRMTVDLSNMRDGPYTFPKDAVRLPEELTLQSIDPATINIAFEERIQETVPVQVATEGEPARGYKVEKLVPKPSQATIVGAESRVLDTDSVWTRGLRLDGHTDSFTESLPIEVPETTPRGLIELVDRNPVQVEVTLSPEMSKRVFAEVPVKVVAGEGVSASQLERFETEPATIEVILHGPLLVVEAFETSPSAIVTLRPDDLVGRPREAEVILQDIPDGVGTEFNPEQVTLRPVRGS
ncbi:MAG: hypothetical protein Tsb0020_42340 [Haliangiales bacterium]